MNETLKWLSSLPILMQKSLWWGQSSVRHSSTLPHLESWDPCPASISLQTTRRETSPTAWRSNEADPGLRMSLKACTKVNGCQLRLVIQQLTKDLEFTEVKRLVTFCPGEADHPSVHDTGRARHWHVSAGHGRHCSALLTVHCDGEGVQAVSDCRNNARLMDWIKAMEAVWLSRLTDVHCIWVVLN